MLKGVSSDKLSLPTSPTATSTSVFSGSVSVNMADKNNDSTTTNDIEDHEEQDSHLEYTGHGINTDYDLEEEGGGIVRSVSMQLRALAVGKGGKYQKPEKPEKPEKPSSTAAAAESSSGGVLLWRQRWRRLGLFQEVKGGGREDVVAGLTVGIMNIPSAIAFTTIAQLPPMVGLYSAAVSLLTYPALGSSHHLSVSPVAIL